MYLPVSVSSVLGLQADAVTPGFPVSVLGIKLQPLHSQASTLPTEIFS